MHVWHTRTAHRLSSGYTCKLVCQTTPQTRQFVQTNLKQWLRWCHTVTLFNTLSGRSRGKLTVEGQTGGQSEAHLDILLAILFSTLPTIHSSSNHQTLL